MGLLGICDFLRSGVGRRYWWFDEQGDVCFDGVEGFEIEWASVCWDDDNFDGVGRSVSSDEEVSH